MTSDKSLPRLPDFIQSVAGELEPGYWEPQTFQEWTEVKKTIAYLNVWVQQQGQERILRKTIAIWVFILITLQVIAVFVLVALDAFKVFVLNVEIVKFLIPSVLGEVFGMGFVVVKYLFRPMAINPFVLGKNK
jgi:hypothetical protein